MPAPTRGQIRRAKLVEHIVDFGDDVQVTFVFDANKMTDGWMADWARHEEETNVPQLNAMLADLIESWDILEDEGGAPIAPTAEEIGSLFAVPDKLLLIKEFAGLPSDAEGNASRNISFSPQTDSSSTPGNPPNGQPPLPTPETSVSPSLTHPT